MFVDVIKVEKKEDIRMGQSPTSYEKSFGQIMKVLEKHKCTKIVTLKDMGEGDPVTKIGFELDDAQYLITIPRVYVGKGRGYRRTYEYNEKIGIRIVYYFLDTMLELVTQRIVDPKLLMLPCRVVHTEKGTMTLGEAFKDNLPPVTLTEGIETKRLEESNE